MNIDFASILYALVSLYALGAIVFAALIGFGVWSLEKYLNRECKKIQHQEAIQQSLPAQFSKPFAKAQT